LEDQWREVRLGDVVTLQRGFDLPSQRRKPGAIPIVSSSGISGRHIEAKVVGPGVVTGRYGTIGQVFFVDEDFWPLNTTLYVRDFKGNDPLFVSYLLRTLDFQSHNDKSSVPGVNRNHLHTAKVRVPPLSEQRAIAAILSALDDKIELNRRMNRTLEAMARAIFTSWFVDFDPVRAKMEGRQPFGMDADTAALFLDAFEDSPLGQIPRGWQVGRFSDTIELLSGGTPKTSVAEYWGGDTPWFSVADAPNTGDVYVIDTEKKITQAGLQRSPAQLLPVGTTIISARGTVGKCALVGVPMAMNQSCYGVRGVAGQGNFYTYFSLRSVVSELQQGSHGSVFDTITRDTFNMVDVVIPPAIIAQQFETIVTPYLQRIRCNLLELRTLGAIRDALLPKLLSGDLRIAEAERCLEKAV